MHRSHFHLYTLILFAVVGAALAGLWLQQMKLEKTVQGNQNSSHSLLSATPTPEVGPSVDITALQDSLTRLQTSENDLAQRVQVLEQKKTGATTNGTSANSANFQTQTVYLGSANSSELEWTNTGVQATLNSADYPANSKVTFEAGLSILGGIASARLVNNTTGAVLAATEVSNNSSNTAWVDSANFTLTPGKNIYEVQLRSSSNEVVNLSGARLIIKQ